MKPPTFIMLDSGGLRAPMVVSPTKTPVFNPARSVALAIARENGAVLRAVRDTGWLFAREDGRIWYRAYAMTIGRRIRGRGLASEERCMFGLVTFERPADFDAEDLGLADFSDDELSELLGEVTDFDFRAIAADLEATTAEALDELRGEV